MDKNESHRFDQGSQRRHAKRLLVGVGDAKLQGHSEADKVVDKKSELY